MIYPLKDFKLVADGQFGSDPATYQQYKLKGHHGVDAIASIGTPVYAPEDAVVFSSSTGAYDQYTNAFVAGEVVVLQGTYEHWLLHLSKRNVVSGQRVSQGQLIGYSGNTGAVFPKPTKLDPTAGQHLHWGVRPLKPDVDNGYRGFIDPVEFMKSQGGDDMVDTEDKARLVFLAVLHDPEPTQDALKSIMGQPWDIVVTALQKYDKWRDQNDKLVAFRALQDAKEKGTLTDEQKKALQLVELLKELAK